MLSCHAWLPGSNHEIGGCCAHSDCSLNHTEVLLAVGMEAHGRPLNSP
jgi:hypothetical protein